LVDAFQGGIPVVDQSHFSFAVPSGAGDKDVKFIIAPGGIPYDVSLAVAEDDNGNPPVPRKILMQSNADTDKRLSDSTHRFPFDKGDPHDPQNLPDPIVQALGSRSVNPTGFRVRHRTSWPTLEGGYPDVSFYAQNGGAAQVGVALLIQGAGSTRLENDKTRFRGSTGAAYDTGIWIDATTRTAIRVQGDVAGSNDVNFLPPGQPAVGVALRMDQEGGPAARKVIGWTTESGNKLVTIGYDPATRSFQIAGAETVELVGAKKFDLGGAALVNPGSRTPSTESPTLRGTETVTAAQSASHGATQPQTVTATITFLSPIAEDYIAMVAPGWVTGFGVAKRKEGFTVTFDAAPPSVPSGQPGQFDWIIYR
ncbi:MAG: hypothetical protein QOJ85_2780, partial [Solirubrobacteraceae bacterium]|nr:hypothetical protein [Solirubrobacteraceae bacterium]